VHERLVTRQPRDADIEEAAKRKAEEDDEDGGEQSQVGSPGTTVKYEGSGVPVNIEIRDADLQARFQRQMEASGSASAEEVLLRLRDVQEEQDRWLQLKREFINAKIHRGIEQLDRGEVVPEDELDAWLDKHKAGGE
jgi:predicted transcriptional regulator